MKWISVEDRLPRDGKTVLITTPTYPRAVTGFYSNSKGQWNLAEKGWNYWHIKNTHWMPLPPPPE